jgi:hypothetical protein
MQKIIHEIDYLVGDKIASINDLLTIQSLEVFSDDTISLLSEISNLLLNNTEIKKFPDVATFAFYCRKANLYKLKKSNSHRVDCRFGKGIIFHITPGNVPVNFAYSLFAGLITGNINIVKIPSKNFEQVDIIVKAIKFALTINKFKDVFANRLYIVRYSTTNQATEFFSSFCDIRIIWGGDDTIRAIRKYLIPPKTTDITFSDRYSIAILDANKYLNYENKLKIAQDFYNDTYLFDQNACTSPHTVFWHGEKEKCEQAQKIFWELFQIKLYEKKFQLQPIHAINKLTTFFSQAISIGVVDKKFHKSNDIWRINNKTLHSKLDLVKCNSGYFNEFNIESLSELTPIITRKYQTISYFGLSTEDFKIWIKTHKPIGVDRIVPIGRTMDFDMIWDGYDLISNLSRTIPIS